MTQLCFRELLQGRFFGSSSEMWWLGWHLSCWMSQFMYSSGQQEMQGTQDRLAGEWITVGPETGCRIIRIHLHCSLLPCCVGKVSEAWHGEQRAVGSPPWGSPKAAGRGAGHPPALGGPAGAAGSRGIQGCPCPQPFWDSLTGSVAFGLLSPPTPCSYSHSSSSLVRFIW